MFTTPLVRRYTGEGTLTCHNCGKPLENKRAIENTPSGQKFFCWAEPNQIVVSCYLRWKRKGFT